MEIVLNEGYDKILEKIRYYKDLYTQHKNEKRANFLRGLEHVCLGCIHYIERYADLAEKLAREEKDTDEQKRFSKIAKCCRNIAHQAPSSFYEAVQALQFSILFDRSVGHGNGYGRMDSI